MENSLKVVDSHLVYGANSVVTLETRTEVIAFHTPALSLNVLEKQTASSRTPASSHLQRFLLNLVPLLMDAYLI